MKGKVTHNGIELDWKAREVLFCVQASDGESNTSEIRQATNFHSEIIKYRFDKLEEAGLLRVHDAEQLPDGRMDAKTVEITEEGSEVVSEGFGTEDEQTLEERLRRIERRSERYKDLRRAYREVEEKKQQLQRQVSKLEVRVQELEVKVERMESED